MAAQEWDWFQREGLIGQISDIRVQNLQVEREDVQKRTFTRWINLHLEKCDPPLEVKDLFLDIQDGRILMALLEVLSGRNLLHEYKSSSHRIFRLNNIAKALKFLEDSNVKLVSIDAAEIADGNPSLVLGLIWNIILFFQIKELTGNLSRNSPPSSLSPGSGGTDSDSSFPPTPTGERSAALSVKDQRKAIRTLLAWVQRKTRKYGVAVQDFAGSWRSGLAFLAVIKAIDPSLVDMKAALEDSMRENLEKAFRIAHDALHIPRLLEPEDIMVDTPDEQSIVTYVAQFLEHFPELEAEDFVDADKDAPIESTFVRIKETPSEQESTVFYVTDDGERAYTVNHDSSHPPPSKVFVCDTPENWKESRPSGSSGPAPSDSLIEVAWQGMDRDTHGASERTYSLSEPPPESSILSRKDNQRSSSLPIKKTVHFETDIFKDASYNKDPVHSQDFDFEGGRRGTKDWWKQDGRVPVVAEENPKQDAPRAPEAASDQALGDISLADSRTGPSPTAQSSAPGNGASERPAGPGEESRPRALLGEETVTADPSEVIEVTLQTVEAMDEEDDFEGIPLKASKFNSDLVDFATTSQAFGEDPPPPEDRPAEEQAPEEQAEKLGKRRSKSAHRMEAPEDEDDPPGTPEQEDGCVLAPEEEPAGKKPEVYEKAKRKSPRPPRGEEEGEAEDPPELGGDLPSNPPSSQVSLETLESHSEEGLDFKRSPPLSKVSVIPHDLFYYPHYEVPLAAVLEAYAEGPEDFKAEDVDFEDPEDYLSDLEPREDEDEPEASESSGSFGGLGEDLSHSPTQEPDRGRGTPAAKPASDPPPAALAPEDHQPREAEARGPAESQQESPNSGNVRSPLEEKATEESVSSKKKEKKKHVDDVESSIVLAPGAGRSSDDLEEDPGFHRVPSRTSHSDSSIYIRRHTNRSLESDHSSYVQLRNAADLDDRRNRMLTRKANHSGEASLRESQSPHSDALAQFVQQPDLMYFILFLWLLVYCLLLFPQLDINRL
ncbi:calmin isoform X2 [Eptesicus fuscus]|uniref:calmin isoform X2 n=1 Tax=Eptesicus fuscus TaxID=29078 RepID=UPI002403B87F|nr:calmin isoform X2 [Eptesicus fuscus]